MSNEHQSPIKSLKDDSSQAYYANLSREELVASIQKYQVASLQHRKEIQSLRNCLNERRAWLIKASSKFRKLRKEAPQLQSDMVYISNFISKLKYNCSCPNVGVVCKKVDDNSLKLVSQQLISSSGSFWKVLFATSRSVHDLAKLLRNAEKSSLRQNKIKPSPKKQTIIVPNFETTAASSATLQRPDPPPTDQSGTALRINDNPTKNIWSKESQQMRAHLSPKKSGGPVTEIQFTASNAPINETLEFMTKTDIKYLRHNEIRQSEGCHQAEKQFGSPPVEKPKSSSPRNGGLEHGEFVPKRHKQLTAVEFNHFPIDDNELESSTSVYKRPSNIVPSAGNQNCQSDGNDVSGNEELVRDASFEPVQTQPGHLTGGTSP